jgi:hypothetical protein
MACFMCTFDEAVLMDRSAHISGQSAFDGYKSWQDGVAPSWQQLNRAVAPSRGKTAMKHSQQPAATPGENSGHEHGGESK